MWHFLHTELFPTRRKEKETLDFVCLKGVDFTLSFETVLERFLMFKEGGGFLISDREIHLFPSLLRSFLWCRLLYSLCPQYGSGFSSFSALFVSPK